LGYAEMTLVASRKTREITQEVPLAGKVSLKNGHGLRKSELLNLCFFARREDFQGIEARRRLRRAP